MLKLSIVIPVFNEEAHIGACLDSIAAQDVMPAEVIVVDNNCTDDTIKIAKKYPFVRIIKEKRAGIAHARNAGFNAVRADIIGRIDADTRLPSHWVSYMTDYLSTHPDHALSGGSYFYDLKPARLFGWIQGQVAFRMNRLIIGHYITWGSNMALPRSLWLAVRDELHNNPEIHEDMDLGIHLHRNGFETTYHAGLKVGIDSRLFSSKRNTRKKHLIYLKMWPRTLSLHNYKRVWLGWIGTYAVYFAYMPLIMVHWVAEKLRVK